MNDNINHDPIDRQLEGEDRFPLMGRDVLSPPLIRLYAIVIERGPDQHDKAHAMLDAMLRASNSRPPRPHKDKDHAWSARAIADRMERWYRLNMEGDEPATRVPTPDDTTFRAPPSHAQIKSARPPLEPEEAS